MLTDDGVHLRRSEMLEAGPAEVLVRAFPLVAAFGKNPALHGFLQPVRLVLFERVQVVQAANEEQIGDLFNDFEGVRDAAGPERVPDAADLILDVASDRSGLSICGITPLLMRASWCLPSTTCLCRESMRRLLPPSLPCEYFPPFQSWGKHLLHYLQN